jgi:hypothetical protein
VSEQLTGVLVVGAGFIVPLTTTVPDARALAQRLTGADRCAQQTPALLDRIGVRHASARHFPEVRPADGVPRTNRPVGGHPWPEQHPRP